MVVTEVARGRIVMLQTWSVNGRGQFNVGRKVMLVGQFNGGRMVVTEVVSLMEGEWSCYRGGH